MSYPRILPVIRKLDCIVHYDPRNTMDGFHNIWMGNHPNKTSWLNALASYRNAGVPAWYLCQMNAKLNGLRREAEPICLDRVEIRLFNTCQSLASAERNYRVQKRVNMPSRQYAPGCLSHRTSSPQSETAQHTRHLPAHRSISRQGRRSTSSSRPIRRQEAIIVGQVGQLPFAWYPQIRSRSAAVPDRLRSSPLAPSSASPDYPQARHSTVYPTATSSHTTQVLGPSSKLPLAPSRMNPVPAIQQQGTSSASNPYIQLPLKNPEGQKILDGAPSSLPRPVMRAVQAIPSPKTPRATRVPDSRPVESSQIEPVALHASRHTSKNLKNAFHPGLDTVTQQAQSSLGLQAVIEEEMGSGQNEKTKSGTRQLNNTKPKRNPAA